MMYLNESELEDLKRLESIDEQKSYLFNRYLDVMVIKVMDKQPILTIEQIRPKYSHINKIEKDYGLVEVLWEYETDVEPGTELKFFKPNQIHNELGGIRGLVSEIINVNYGRQLVKVVILDKIVNDLELLMEAKKTKCIIDNPMFWEYDFSHLRTHNFGQFYKGDYNDILIDKKLSIFEIRSKIIKLLNEKKRKFTNCELNNLVQQVKKSGRIQIK